VTANEAAFWILFILIVGSVLRILIRRRILRSKREREKHEWLVAKRLLETESEDRKR